jgi:molybdopterin/thiamine biosynthesis adenylyltransferase
MPKVESLAALHALNPGVKVHCLQQRADDALLDHAVPRASVVLDCSDNYRTRHAINAPACATGSTGGCSRDPL